MRGEKGFEQKSNSQSCLVMSQWTERRRRFQRLCGSPHGWTQGTRAWVREESSGGGRVAHSDRASWGSLCELGTGLPTRSVPLQSRDRCFLLAGVQHSAHTWLACSRCPLEGAG